MAPNPGTKDAWPTAITSIEPNRLLVRGYALDELMGRASFSEVIYLLVTGEAPSGAIGRLVAALFVGYSDEGAGAPAALAARQAVKRGASVIDAVATGVKALEPAGGISAARLLLDEGLDIAGDSVLFASAAAVLAEQLVQTDRIPPAGFGTSMHTTDPRVARLLQLAHELEMDHAYTQYLRALEHALARHPALVDERLPVHLDGALAAITGDLGLPIAAAEGLALVARVPGILAHVVEELHRGPAGQGVSDGPPRYDGPTARRWRDG